MPWPTHLGDSGDLNDLEDLDGLDATAQPFRSLVKKFAPQQED